MLDYRVFSFLFPPVMFMSGFEIRIMTHKMNGEVSISSLFPERVFMIALISFLNI